jgi:hypothetical protein
LAAPGVVGDQPCDAARRCNVLEGKGATVVRNLTLLCFASLVSCTVFAQTPSAWVGTWKVTWPNAQGRVQEARLVVTEAGAGSWQTHTRALDNPCIGKEVPIQVEKATDTEAKILLKFGDSIAGCTNSSVNLKVGENQAVTGTRGKLPLTLEKR